VTHDDALHRITAEAIAKLRWMQSEIDGELLPWEETHAYHEWGRGYLAGLRFAAQQLDTDREAENRG